MKMLKMQKKGREERMNKQEKDNGITLVALVITVIIIIILATVTLNFTFRRRRNNNESKSSKIYDTIFSVSRRIRII